MVERPARRPASTPARRPGGWRRLAYWGGRCLQVLGLIILWWVLMLFASVAGMWGLLFWSLVAAAVFYAGWMCIVWAQKGL